MELPTDIVWEKFTSDKGTEYEVGYSAQAETNDHDMQAKDGGTAHGRPFHIEVNWPVGSGKWIDTTPEVRRVTAITKYCLVEELGLIHAYKFGFVCEDTHNYRFFLDKGIDIGANCRTPGAHFIFFNSEVHHTAIIAVSGA